MHTGISRLFADLQKAVSDNSEKCAVKSAADEVVGGIKILINSKSPDAFDALKAFKKACVDMEIQGYEGEKIYVEGGAQLGNLTDVPGWGEDLEKWEAPWPRYVDKIGEKSKVSLTAKIEKDEKEDKKEDRKEEDRKEEDRKEEDKRDENATREAEGKRWGAKDKKDEKHPEDCDCKDCKMEHDRKENDAFIKKMRKDAEEEERKKEDEREMDTAMKMAEKEHEDDMKEMSETEKDSVLAYVRKNAKDAKSVSSFLSDAIPLFAKDEKNRAADALAARGLKSEFGGSVVTRHEESKPGAQLLDRLNLMSDEWYQSDPLFQQYQISPGSSDQQALRRVNEKRLRPIVDEMMKELAGVTTMEAALKFATDSRMSQKEADFVEEFAKEFQAQCRNMQDSGKVLASDATTMSNLYTQPSIAEWFLMRSYFDMQQLPNVRLVPPTGANGANWLRNPLSGARMGTTLRVMSEYWTDGANLTYQSGSYDAGGITGETTAVEFGTVNNAWQEYGSFQREFGFAVSMAAILQTGHGPLHYPAIMRSIFNVMARASRARDKALADEQFNFASEYNAIAVTNEVYGTTPLADNSVGPASGAVTVNLNPTKTAVSAVAPVTGYATADPFITYAASVPSGAPAGASAIVAALRLRCGGNGTSSPYVGNALGIGLVVRPRTTYTISAAGVSSTSTVNPIAISSPSSQVLGNYDPVLKVILNPTGGGTATFAVDFNNSNLVFNTTAGLTLSGGVITTSITVSSYTYATNFTQFVTDPNYFAAPIASTADVAVYYNGLVRQFDQNAANLANYANVVKPDLAQMNVNLSVPLLGATVFYKLNSPKGTELFPEELYFAERNGVNCMRTNVPSNMVDQWIYMGRRQTTCLALDTPPQVRGPIDVQSGGILNQLAYIEYEREVINTIVPIDQSGVVINQPSNLIRCYKVAASPF